MPFAIRVSDFGTNVTEVKISKWLVEVGAPVRRGTILAEIETDKLTAELECVAEGMLQERCAQAGEMVEAGRSPVARSSCRISTAECCSSGTSKSG